jgi:TonB family protein
MLWFFLLERHNEAEPEAGIEPVMAMLIVESHPRDDAAGSAPNYLESEVVRHLQKPAPDIQDLPLDEPVPITGTEPLIAASTPIAVEIDAGLDGNDSFSSGPTGGSGDSSGSGNGGRSLKVVQRVFARYPTQARARGVQGSAGVAMHVAESGRVDEAKILRSTGSPQLDAAAVAAARKWKFAPVPQGSAPDGQWTATEFRFIAYRFAYSRLGSNAADAIFAQETKDGEIDVQQAGSQEALTRFIEEVRSGSFTGDQGGMREEIAKMRAALAEWGAVGSVQFTGAAGPREWTSYVVSAGPGEPGKSVEVSWSMFDVRHQRVKSAWLVAIDREGTVWSARASPAPWL